MKQSYLTLAFEKTVTQDFPERAEALKAAYHARLNALRAENADASLEKQRHLESQILPGIAAYEVLQSLMRIPGLYRRVPALFAKGTRKLFGESAGFAAKELQVSGGVWRIDMVRCPYHDTCVRYGCPELCPSFCDSDDITYGALHPRLLWRRTQTLGRGDPRCDFCLKFDE